MHFYECCDTFAIHNPYGTSNSYADEFSQEQLLNQRSPSIAAGYSVTSNPGVGVNISSSAAINNNPAALGAAGGPATPSQQLQQMNLIAHTTAASNSRNTNNYPFHADDRRSDYNFDTRTNKSENNHPGSHMIRKSIALGVYQYKFKLAQHDKWNFAC